MNCRICDQEIRPGTPCEQVMRADQTTYGVVVLLCGIGILGVLALLIFGAA